MNLTHIARRVDALHAATVHVSKRTARGFRCQGLDFESMAQVFQKSLAPESEPVAWDIVAQVREYESLPPKQLPNEGERPRIHGFTEWLLMLLKGSSSLPEKIPHDLLLAWRNGYANQPANCQQPAVSLGGSPITCTGSLQLAANGCVDEKAVCDRCGKRDFVRHTPVPVRRCEDCLLVLPNRVADGSFGCFARCPACDSEDISHPAFYVPVSLGEYVPDTKETYAAHREGRLRTADGRLVAGG